MRKLVINIFILNIFFISCQKNLTNDPEPNPPSQSLTDDSTHLTKYVDIDTAQVSGKDTGYVVKYFYDNLKRVTRKEIYEFPYQSSTPSHLDVNTFSYNSLDTLPYKKIWSYYSLPNLILLQIPDTGFYTYLNGKKVSDSVQKHSAQPSGNYGKFTYLYTSTSIKKINQNQILGVYYITKANGNLIQQKDTSMSGGNIRKFSYTYDINPNPFYGIPQGIERDKPYFDIESYPEEFEYERNNVTDLNNFEYLNSPTQYNLHLKYIHTYKTNGYPSITRMKDINNLSNYFKRIYFYSN